MQRGLNNRVTKKRVGTLFFLLFDENGSQFALEWEKGIGGRREGLSVPVGVAKGEQRS